MAVAKRTPRVTTAPRPGRMRREPQQHRSRQRIADVIEATKQLVVELEPADVTTTLVAERAGVSVAWIYQYFEDRQAIFDTIVLVGDPSAAGASHDQHMSDGMIAEADDLDTADVDAAVATMLADAGQIALRYFRTAIDADDKGGVHGFDPVTEADRGVEDLLRARLHDEFGDHEVLGEERGSSGTPGRYRWLIDPIDGTKAFVTGSPLWGILLGLLDDGKPVAGWMHQPYIGETFAGFVGGDAAQAWVERDGAAHTAGDAEPDVDRRARRCTRRSRACSGRTTSGRPSTG